MSKIIDYKNETLLSNKINSDSNSTNENVNKVQELNENEDVQEGINNNTDNTTQSQDGSTSGMNRAGTNDASVNEISDTNNEEEKFNSDSSYQIPGENQIKLEDQATINKRNYNIKENVLIVLKWIILAALIQNILVVILIAAYLFTEFNLFALYSLISIIVSIILNSIISYSWEKLNEETKIKFTRIFLFEIVKYHHYRCYRECIESSKIFKESIRDQNSIYIETIRKIDDLRYYIITTGLLYGSIQILLQFYILIKMFDNIFTLPLQIIVLLTSIVLICLSIFITRNKFCDFKDDLGKYRVSMLRYFLTLNSMFLYVLDIFSDFAVAIRYFYDLHLIRGAVSLLFIILPGIYITWHKSYQVNMDFKIPGGRIIIMLLNLQPVIGYMYSLKCQMEIRKSEIKNNRKQRIASYKSYITNNYMVAKARYNECITESCSQLIIQISFLLSRINFLELRNEKFAIISSGISVLNVVVSTLLHSGVNRIEIWRGELLPIELMAMQFIGYIPVASRIIALSFLASVHPYITFLAMFLHWLLIYIWITCTSRINTLPLYIDRVIQAISYIYTPAMNSSLIEIIFHIIFFIENIAAILVWSYSLYERLTTNGILILIFAIIVPSFVGYLCRYFYKKKYDTYLDRLKFPQ